MGLLPVPSRFTTCEARRRMFYFADTVKENPNLLGTCLQFTEVPFTFKPKQTLEGQRREEGRESSRKLMF